MQNVRREVVKLELSSRALVNIIIFAPPPGGGLVLITIQGRVPFRRQHTGDPEPSLESFFLSPPEGVAKQPTMSQRSMIRGADELQRRLSKLISLKLCLSTVHRDHSLQIIYFMLTIALSHWEYSFLFI